MPRYQSHLGGRGGRVIQPDGGRPWRNASAGNANPRYWSSEPTVLFVPY